MRPAKVRQSNLFIASRIRRFLHGFNQGEEQGSDEVELVTALLEVMHQSDRFEDKSTATQRRRALNDALELINAHSDTNVPINTLCETVGVSLRTLNRAFNDTFGCGPKAYLLRTRLSQVRNDLLRSDSSAKVVDVANRWGFWHIGQLARDYRKLFGELPTDTLQYRSAAKIIRGQ